MERNYKFEIYSLIKKINNTNEVEEQFNLLEKLCETIEKFIESFNKNIEDNFAYKEKMHFYLTYLFNTYSCLFNLKTFLNEFEEDNILSKIKKYLEIFEKKGTTFCPSLVYIFKNNDDEIFGELCIQILGYYSQKGTELYSNNEKKYAKHYL